MSTDQNEAGTPQVAPKKAPKSNPKQVTPDIPQDIGKRQHSMMVYGIHPTLRQRLKIAAYAQNTTMRAVVVEAIEKYVQTYEAKKG